ncbi:MAG: hypothetical protein AAGA81_12240 [Acidobacteriota bacterium]
MSEEDPSPTRRFQSIAFGVLVASAVLGLGASTGFTPLPQGGSGLAPFLHPLLAGLGAAAGVLAVRRAREIDRIRWRYAEDETLTPGERRLAHREADRETRVAGSTFLLAAIAVGGWLAYQLKDPERFTAAELLIVTPALGFALALPFAAKRFPPVTSADDL